MKTLGSTMWTFVWVLVILGAVSGGTIYPGKEALLSYNPARGEFPVQSLFGRGFFGFIDEHGNSRIVTLEANPLLGVRVGADGEPLIEAGLNADLENEKKDKNLNPKDRLKPIKEFDENPFLDAVVENVVKDSKNAALIALPSMIPGPKEPATMYLPPSTPAGGFKDSLPVPVTIPGQQGPVIMYLPPTSQANSHGDLEPSVPQQGPAVMYLPPSTPSDSSKDSLPSLPVPTIIAPGQQPQVPAATKSSLPSLPVPAIIAPGQQPQVPAATKSLLPTLPPVPAIIAPGQQPQAPVSVLPKQGTTVEAVLSPINPFLPSTIGLVLLNPSPAIQAQQVILTPQSTSDIVFPNSPLLAELGGVFPNTPPPAQSNLPAVPGSGSSFNQPLPATGLPETSGVFHNPPAPGSGVFPNPPPPGSGKLPALTESGVFSNPPLPATRLLPNSVEHTGSAIFPNPPPPATTSPILATGNPFLPIGGVPPTRPPPTVFPNPPPPTPSVFPNPKPTKGENPFLSLNSIRDKPLSHLSLPTTPKPEFKPNENNPFLPRVELDADIRSLSPDSNTSLTLEGDKNTETLPDQVKDTPEVEQAKREHFLAHELALARLAMAEQQDANERADESSLSPMASGSDSPLVYLPPVDVASPQPVTSGPSAIVLTEQTNIVESDAVSQKIV